MPLRPRAVLLLPRDQIGQIEKEAAHHLRARGKRWRGGGVGVVGCGGEVVRFLCKQKSAT
eukprot:6180095-Pleurochrysis_carterae.AAC.1